MNACPRWSCGNGRSAQHIPIVAGGVGLLDFGDGNFASIFGLAPGLRRLLDLPGLGGCELHLHVDVRHGYGVGKRVAVRSRVASRCTADTRMNRNRIGNSSRSAFGHVHTARGKTPPPPTTGDRFSSGYRGGREGRRDTGARTGPRVPCHVFSLDY